jgi:hypothetical protein
VYKFWDNECETEQHLIIQHLNKTIVNLCFLNGVFINRFPLASPSETRECPEKESISSTDKRTTHEQEEAHTRRRKKKGITKGDPQGRLEHCDIQNHMTWRSLLQSIIYLSDFSVIQIIKPANNSNGKLRDIVKPNAQITNKLFVRF